MPALSEIEWIVELKENVTDSHALHQTSAYTGLNPDELTTKGLSVLLRKS